jgi:hypothetical protein
MTSEKLFSNKEIWALSILNLFNIINKTWIILFILAYSFFMIVFYNAASTILHVMKCLIVLTHYNYGWRTECSVIWLRTDKCQWALFILGPSWTAVPWRDCAWSLCWIRSYILLLHYLSKSDTPRTKQITAGNFCKVLCSFSGASKIHNFFKGKEIYHLLYIFLFW